MSTANSAADSTAREPLVRRLRGTESPEPWWIAYSGGADSLALLDAAAHCGRSIRALHVDHRLQSASADWAQHCAEQARRLGVPCDVVRADVLADGEGLEAAARQARYTAFERCLTRGGTVLTAHHRDDQAETLLLQLLRGTGLNGLAAMPACRGLGGGFLARPLLDLPPAALRRAAAASGLDWIEDPSNSDTSLDRNFLRRRVLPLLEQRWPGVHGRLHRAARHAGEGLTLLERLAGDRVGDSTNRLPLAVLRDLDETGRCLVVREWLRAQGVRPPGERRLRQGLAQLTAAGPDRAPVLAWERAQVRRHRGELVLLPARLPEAAPALCSRGAPALALACGGGLWFRGDGGVALSVLERGWVLAPRAGGERVRWRGRQRAVKKLLQEADVPSWEKARYPVLWQDGRVIAVPDLAVADAVYDPAGLMPLWVPAWRRGVRA